MKRIVIVTIALLLLLVFPVHGDFFEDFSDPIYNPSAPLSVMPPITPSNFDILLESRNDREWEEYSDQAIMQGGHQANCGNPFHDNSGSHPILRPEDSVYACKNHIMTAIRFDGNDNYGLVYITPNHLVDFSQGTAVVEYDLSTLDSSFGREWTDFWIQPFDSHLAQPLQDWLPDLQGYPKDAVWIGQGAGQDGYEGSIIRNYDVNTIDDDEIRTGVWEAMTPCNGNNDPSTTCGPSAKNRVRHRLEISRTHMKFYAPDLGLVWVDVDINPPLDWDRGTVQFGHHSYTPSKCIGGGDCGNKATTYHWDDFLLSPSIPFTMIQPNKRQARKDDPVVVFDSPAPANSFLRFSAMGTVDVSLDGGPFVRADRQDGSNEADGEHAAGHHSSYWHAIPEGTQQVEFRWSGDGWWEDWRPMEAIGMSIWSLTTDGSPPPVIVCGDGVREGIEQCDDGNSNNADTCTTSCLFTSCGDGTVQNPNGNGQNEQCDDGNTANGDSCTALCQIPQPGVCGNGVVEDDEQCDDGDNDNTDTCSNSCALTYCGDGIEQSPNGQGSNEECDDGNTVGGDTCDAQCQDPPGQACGNGAVEGTEQCDDGNKINGDGCSSLCFIETQVPACGNDIVETGEQCDDGNTVSGDGCSSVCQTEILPPSGVGNRVNWQGQDWFLAGVNMPWQTWPCDFGGSAAASWCEPFRVSNPSVQLGIGQSFSELQSKGINTVRWWTFEGGALQIERDGAGRPTRLHPEVYEDFDAAVALAEQYDIYYQFTLFAGLTDIPESWMTNAQHRTALVDALRPLFRRYGSNPHVMTWELFNEPGWQIQNNEVALGPAQDLARELTAAIHEESHAMVTIGEAHADHLSNWVGIGLDYYDAHWYDYMSSGGWCVRCNDYEFYVEQEGLDAPLVIGEFYGGTSSDASQRWTDWESKGYAGAYAWSFRPQSTSDNLNIDMSALESFVETQDDSGPQSGSAPTQICGNNVREGSEACDDGNVANGDGCNALCQVEFCGDGVLQTGLGEECDDGNILNGDSCDAQCQDEPPPPPPPDVTPPVMTNGQPTGVLPVGTTIATLSIDTDEDATCKYSTADASYGVMTATFEQTGGTDHRSTLTILDGQAYSFFIRCSDGEGNANTASYTVQFSVDAAPPPPPVDTTPPVISNGQPQGMLPVSTRTVTISVDTDEDATCTYQNTGSASVQVMDITGGRQHSSTIDTQDGDVHSYDITCFDESNNVANENEFIQYSVDVVSPPPVNEPPTDDEFPIPFNAWRGDYFETTNFEEYTFTRLDENVDFNWEQSGPTDDTSPNFDPDTFSVRWRGTFSFEQSTYTFTARSDDGVRLYVDGELLIDEWKAQQATTFSADKIMTEGIHEITVEYFEDVGSAVIVADWERNEASPPAETVCGNGIVEEGEQCDDGNENDFDSCSAACVDQSKKSSSSGGGGGGGGGGGSRRVNDKAFRQYFNVVREGLTNIKIENDDLPLTSMNVHTNDAIRSVNIEALLLDGQPKGVAPLEKGPVFAYLEISSPELIAELTEKITFGFNVPRKWVDELRGNPANIVLYHYKDDRWHALPTRNLGSNVNEYVHSAELDGFSYFAIALSSTPASPVPQHIVTETGEELQIKEITDEETGEEIIVVEEPESVQRTKDVNFVLFGLLLIAAAMGASGVYFAAKHYHAKQVVHEINMRVMEDYIVKTRKLRYSDAQIVKALTLHGYSSSEVRKAMKELKSSTRNRR